MSLLMAFKTQSCINTHASLPENTFLILQTCTHADPQYMQDRAIVHQFA
jgi:hypothetical protein